MTPIIEYYKKGWADCLGLLEMLSKDEGYDNWDAVIAELKQR